MRSFYRGELALLKSLWLDSVQAGVSPAKRETAGTSEPFARHGGQAEQAAVASPELQGAISQHEKILKNLRDHTST